MEITPMATRGHLSPLKVCHHDLSGRKDGGEINLLCASRDDFHVCVCSDVLANVEMLLSRPDRGSC